MGYLIDTCIWIDVERGALSPADVATTTKNEPVYLCAVTIAELKYGAQIAKPAIRQKRLVALEKLKRKPCLKIDEITGDIFGDVAAALDKNGRGHRFRIQDLWMACLAIQHNLKLLTHNVKDFADIPGLDVVKMPGK